MIQLAQVLIGRKTFRRISRETSIEEARSEQLIIDLTLLYHRSSKTLETRIKRRRAVE